MKLRHVESTLRSRAISYGCRALALLGSLLFLGVSLAQQREFSKAEIKVTHVAGNLYLLQGARGNIAASIGDDGVVLVDDGESPLLAPKIAAALESIAPAGKVIRYVFNTHYHYDHTGGNGAFARQGATIIGHENLRARMLQGGTGGNGGSIHITIEPAEKSAVPMVTFDHVASVYLNDEEIRAVHLPTGHTDGDAIVFFPKENVVDMGDDYVRYGFPFIDVDAGGSVQGMIAACQFAIEKLPADARVIPGHGEISTVAELRAYVQMLIETSSVISKALKTGKSLEQMGKDRLLAPWAKQYSTDIVSTDAFLEMLFYSLVKGGQHTPAAD
jgi:glyoxylase-like metal-dependent hydrolase (beta-lactamase superfamily II)